MTKSVRTTVGLFSLCRPQRLAGASMELMVNRASIHALVDDLAEEQLALAKKALEEVRGFDVSEEDRRELLEREADCDQGNAIEARAFLQRLRREAADSGR